jgi:Ni,Fe-hydrogenase III large subunit
LSFWTWLKSKFSSGSIPLGGDLCSDDLADAFGDLYIREMAFWSAVNLVANAVSKCEIKTFENGKEVKKQEYYLWNIEPNRNQNSSAF